MGRPLRIRGRLRLNPAGDPNSAGKGAHPLLRWSVTVRHANARKYCKYRAVMLRSGPCKLLIHRGCLPPEQKVAGSNPTGRTRFTLFQSFLFIRARASKNANQAVVPLIAGVLE